VIKYRLTNHVWAGLLAGGLCCTTLLAQSSAAVDATVIEKGVTQPSKRVEMAFNVQGVIGKVNVVEGDVVRAGQALMQQDDKGERARLEALQIEADQTALIKGKTAILENKRLVAKRKYENFLKKAVAESESQEAQADAIAAEAEVEIAKQQGRQKEAEVRAQADRVEKMTLKCPVESGIVEKVVQSQGEMANIDKPSIVLVRNDPLYIDVKTLPTNVVQRLKKGDTLPVRYPGDEQWHPATINFIAPVADARAGTQSIRLEMPNPDGRSTGLAVDVKIPNATVADAR
jgi:membrane fusion protein, multidrug efflux system